MYSEKFLKTLRLLTSPFLAMLEPFFTQRALKRNWTFKGDSKVTRRALEHLRTQALGHSKDTWALRHSRTRALGHLRNFI